MKQTNRVDKFGVGLPLASSQPIRFEYFWILNISWMDWCLSCFGCRQTVVKQTRIKLPPLSKLVRIVLETWSVVINYTVVSENIPCSTKASLILLMSVLFCKKSFFVKNNTFSQSNSMRAVLEFFQFYCQFL